MLSIYDDALIRFFRQLRWMGKDIPTVFAGPDRAHSQVKEWLKLNRGIDVGQSAGERALPYPFTAVWMDRWKPDQGLSENPGQFRLPVLPNDGVGLAIKKPRPVSSQVDVNIYCKDYTQSQYIELMLHMYFPQAQAWIPVNYRDTRWYQPPNDVFSFAKSLGEQKLYLHMDSITDNSSIENSGLQGKEARMTVTCTLRGWIPFQPYSVPLVHELEYMLVDKESEETIAVTTVTDE